MLAKKAQWAAKSGLYRKWLAKKLLNEFPRYARHRWEDFEPDDVLRYVGLTTYKPGRLSLGGIGAFVAGACVGGLVALMLAPRPGVEIRSTVKDKAMGYLGKQPIGIGPEKTASA